MTRVLVTGVTGFVGSRLAERLITHGVAVRGTGRRAGTSRPGLDYRPLALDGDTDWKPMLPGVDCVVHAAARVHVMAETSADSLDRFRRVNVAGSERLARHAAAAGVRRLIFLSSIKVNGEGTASEPFTAADEPAPADPYGISKQEAEARLRQVAHETGLAVTIIRPPLVYGPGVKANFLSMMRWLNMGVPLPLGAIHNRRSLVALDNLVDLIATCIDHPAAANQTFLVSDDEDLSTTDLLRRMGEALNRPARLIPVPARLIEAAGSMLGKREVAQRLCGSLQVDISSTRELLGWSPPVSVDEGLQRAAAHFLASQRA